MPITICAVGDISLGDHPVRAGFGGRRLLERNPEPIVRSVRKLLPQSDICMANLETIASNIGYKHLWLPSHEMRGDPQSLHKLSECGFNLLGVANNHAMQHGSPAFEDTISAIKSAGIRPLGLDDDDGMTIPVVHTKDGESCRLVAFSLRPEQWARSSVPYSLRKSPVDVLDEVRKIRQAFSGSLVVSVHWGLEFLHQPTAPQIYLGRALIDAGVDVVVGHHPHVLQPVEEYGGGLIFYSLGNFLFDLWPDAMRHTILAHISLQKDRTPQWSVRPLYICEDMQLRDASEQERHYIDNMLFLPIGPTPDAEDLRSLERKAERLYAAQRRKFRHSSYRYLAKNLLRAPPHYTLQQIGRTVLRRLSGH